MQTGHFGVGPGLVDEDQPVGIEPALIAPPVGSGFCYIGTFLLAGMSRLFF